MSAKNHGMVAGRWFALLRRPEALPVLFASRDDARENCDFDEYLVEVIVRPASLMLLGRGERWVREQEKKKKKRPTEQKRRRRGSVNLKGVDALRSELEKMAPRMRQRFQQAIELEARALLKGGGRAAAARLRR